jgi:hypothetical protein
MTSPSPIFIRHFHQTVSISAQLGTADQLGAFFQLTRSEPQPTNLAFEIDGNTPSGPFEVSLNGTVHATEVDLGAVIDTIAAALAAEDGAAGGALLRCAAVGWGEKCILITGDDPSVELLLAWFVDHDCSYVSRSAVVLGPDDSAVAGFPGPFSVSLASVPQVSRLASFRHQPSVAGLGQVHIQPDPSWLAPDGPLACGLVIHASRLSGANVHLAVGDDAQISTALRFSGAPRNPSHDGAELLQKVPTIAIQFDDLAALSKVLQRFICIILEDELTKADVAAHFSSIAVPSRAPLPKIFPIPQRSMRTLTPRLTIGMACYDDFDGVYFSLQALRMYHPEIIDQVELLVIDNHPDGPAGQALKSFEDKAPNYRYVPQTDIVGTAARDYIFREAAGEFVLGMDCHVLFVPGAIAALLRYFEANPETNDLIQGPILWEGLASVSSHWEPIWRGGMFGIWANDPAADDPDAPPFDIPMQGFGVFACRRLAWPGFNPRFSGFGGDEGYMHEKFRQRGGRVLCLPALRWMHRFERPMGIPYPIKWEDRFRNYILGRIELGMPYDDVLEHMRQHVGEGVADQLLKQMLAANELQA